jgi:ABC-type multidrug transport system ATPase subunit
MDLLECADVAVEPLESKKKGISGGQLRRLSIAIALLKNPSILILGMFALLALQGFFF